MRPEPQRTPASGPSADPRTVRIVRLSLLGLVVAVLLLVFAVPRKPPPPPSPAQPDQAFIDRIGLVPEPYAREWAGALLNDPRAEIVIYVDARPPEGDLAAWTTQAASDWKVGSAKKDTGLVLFVFGEPRIARMEVGYGMEGTFPDARVRQLLETHLAPHFARGDYQRGFDAYIKALRDELGGDAGMARAAGEAVKAKDPPLMSQIVAAYAGAPRMASAVVRRYGEESYGARFAILVFTAVALGVALTGLAAAAVSIGAIAAIPARLRARGGRGAAGGGQAEGPAGWLMVFPIVMGFVAFALCAGLLSLVLMAAETFVTRKGNFSGAGAAIVWPAQ
ncbi:MAG: TPM domain-containing protein [Burkholderiales bacterium]